MIKVNYASNDQSSLNPCKGRTCCDDSQCNRLRWRSLGSVVDPRQEGVNGGGARRGNYYKKKITTHVTNQG